MGMTIGELVATLGLDSSQFNRGIDDAESAVRSRGRRIGAAAKAVGAAAGAAAGAGLAVGMAANLEIGEAQAKLTAQLGVSGEEAGRLGGVAGKLYADAYGGSLSEVNDAVRSVVQNIGGMGDVSDSELQSITGQVMSLSAAFEQDLGQSTRAVDKMLRTGLAGSAQEALDILARGFQTGADQAGDLLDTFSEYSTQFRKLGVDGQTAMGLISQGLAAGARDADVVADGIKEFTDLATSGSESASQAFRTLNLDAAQMAAQIAKGGPDAAAGLDTVLDRLRAMPPGVERNTTAIGLFGEKAIDLGDALYSLDPSAAVAALGDVAGAAQNADSALQETASKSVEGMKRSMQMLAAEATQLPGPLGTAAAGLMAFGPSGLSAVASLSMIGMAVGPLLGRLAGMGLTLATTVGKWAMLFGRLVLITVTGVGQILLTLAVWAAQQVARAAVALASMAVTAATYLASWVMMAAGALVSAASMAAAWIMAMGPVGWVIAAVVALVALIIANWDTVKQWTVDAWTAVTDAISAAWDWIVSVVQGGIETAKSILMWFAELPGLVADWFGGMVSSATAKLGELISWVTGLPGRILSALGSLGSLLLNAGRDLISGLWNGISGMGSWLWDKIIGFVKSFVPGPILSFLGIASPSKFMRDEVGRWIPEGLGDGIIANASAASDAARAMAADTADAALGATGSVRAGSLPGDAWVSPGGSVSGSQGPSAGELAAAVGSAVHGALNGARMEVDGSGVARLVNRSNLKDRRRSLTPAI